jgi:hypothetical protein
MLRVADSSSTLTEAATIDGLYVGIAFAGEEPAHDLAGERQAERALVGGLGADDRITDARGNGPACFCRRRATHARLPRRARNTAGA